MAGFKTLIGKCSEGHEGGLRRNKKTGRVHCEGCDHGEWYVFSEGYTVPDRSAYGVAWILSKSPRLRDRPVISKGGLLPMRGGWESAPHLGVAKLTAEDVAWLSAEVPGEGKTWRKFAVPKAWVAAPEGVLRTPREVLS